MKKLLMVLILGLAFAGNANIRETISNGNVLTGQGFINFNVINQQVLTPSYGLTFYGDNIRGFSSIALDYMAVSSGNSTTMSAQPIFPNGTNAGTAQIITAGAVMSTLKSPWYKFTYSNNVGVTTNVTFNFNIVD